MSVENPEPFDILKVSEFIPGDDKNKPSYGDQMILNCVKRGTVKEQYAANSTDNITFDVINDGSAGFNALHDGSLIFAGDQIYEVSQYTRKTQGGSSASISADQVANAELSRFVQHEPMANSDTKAVYWTYNDLINWFTKDNNIAPFKFHPMGYFPQRMIKVSSSMDGKTLLQTIVKTWPGTVCRPWGYDIWIYGYKHDRGSHGELIQYMDTDTGLRFDAMRDAKEVTVTRDFSKIINAVEVKSATYNMTSGVSGSGDDENQNDTDSVKTKPFFRNFVVKCDESIKKYGLHFANEAVTDVVKPSSGVSSARERMVTKPQISLTAVIDTPGETGEQPKIGYKYTIGLSALDNEIFHTRLVGYIWYPFDSTKGTTLTLNSVDPGIIGSLSTMIVHDAELSPSATEFKAIQAAQDNADGANEDDNTGSSSTTTPGTYSTTPGDGGDINADATQTRDPDPGTGEGADGQMHQGGKVDANYVNPNAGTQQGGGSQGAAGQNGKDAQACLPISDKYHYAHIFDNGSMILNHKDYGWNIYDTRKETPDSSHLDFSNDDKLMDDYKNGKKRHKDGNDSCDNAGPQQIMHVGWTNSFNDDTDNKYSHTYNPYTDANMTVGDVTLCSSGLIALTSNPMKHDQILYDNNTPNTAGQFTFRAGVVDQDFDSNGDLKNHTIYDNDDNPHDEVEARHDGSIGGFYYNDKDNTNAGEMATINVGSINIYDKPHRNPKGNPIMSLKCFGDASVHGNFYAKDVHNHHSFSSSQLSKKKNVKRLSKEKALNTVLSTDVGTYQYKDDKDGEKQASVIIDDVHKKPQWKTPKAFMSKDGKERNDATQVGYLIKAVQALYDKDQNQQKEIEELQKTVKQLTHKK